jgi:CheY-like chemotaxis protein
MSKKILVIDDEPDVRTFLTTVLKKHGYETVTAADGVEGLKMLKQERPVLVTLDLQMPNNTGTDFYRKLIKDKQLGQTPVIVISGLPGRHLAVSEPAAVFDKPIDPDAFIEAVERALEPTKETP